MRCPVCGQSYGLTHQCLAPTPAPPVERPALSPPLRFLPVHYFLEGVRIARWDDAAIRRCSQDNNALLYGSIIWAIGNLIILLSAAVLRILRGLPMNWAGFVLALFFLFPLLALMALAQYGLCHLLARTFFRATGTFLGVLRPLLLGWVVMWLYVIPLVGPIVAGLGFLAVLMLVFEEVEGIQRLQAFGIAFGVGLVFWGLSLVVLRRM